MIKEKVSDYQNSLNDLKVMANAYLDKYHSDKKLDILKEKKDKIELLLVASKTLGGNITSQEDLCKSIFEGCKQMCKSDEDSILEVAIYALAWDELETSIKN